VNQFMRDFSDHPLGRWMILVLAVSAGIILLKLSLARLPDQGIPGAIKSVGMSI
jgi:hypothetical protein